MAFNQLTKIVTPAGVAVYPHIRTTEVYEGNDTGKYTCGIILSKEDTDKLISKIETEWEMAKKELQDKRFGRNTAPSLGFHEDKNGDIVFKAKSNAVIKTKTGDVFEKSIPVYDKYGKLIDKDIEVGNGSTIQLSIQLRPFYGSSTIYGIQLLLQAVRVINLVPYSANGTKNASDFGFECEKGNEAEEEYPIPFGTDADF